jgi:hypothetical protein
MEIAVVMPVIIAMIVCIGRVVVVGIALRGVPPAKRAEVLKGVAECFRWWRSPGS